MAQLLAPIRTRFTDANGDPISGGKLFSYVAGTSTPLVTYKDQTELVENTNPIVLDANGEADVWIGSGVYKFVLKSADDMVIHVVDGVASLYGLSIATAMIQAGSVTEVKIANNAVSTRTVQNLAITAAKLAIDSVETAKIKDGAVIGSKIGPGAVTSDKIENGAITKSKQAAMGQQVSASSGTFSTTSLSFVDVTNLSVNITTTGRPVVLALVPDPTDEAKFEALRSSTDDFGLLATANYQFLRGATSLGSVLVGSSGSDAFDNVVPNNLVTALIPIGSVHQTDFPSAGTYTYKLQVRRQSATSVALRYCKLVAYEL